ncbi:MAG: universal stress protein [Rhodanobacter sp.]|nr:MAG: universal stress protein [Rhodanobacter sp.]
MLDFIVNVGKAKGDSELVRGALRLASQHPSFLTGLQLVPAYPSLLEENDSMAELAAAEDSATARRAWWLETCRAAGVTGNWEVLRGDPADALARRSRLADLVIGELPISDPDAPAGFDEVTRTLFAQSSAMLLVPDVWHGELAAKRILVAWNGSGEAAHAVKAALPLLKQARTVQVLDGERVALSGISPPRLPLREWFERHDIETQWHAFPSEHDAGRALHHQAKTLNTDLMVMGAWGRSRLRELMLGGATRWMLENATLPLLLAR